MKFKKNFFEKFIYILFLFFLGALLGGMMETFYIFFLFNRFNIGGFMYGPWRPIYGYGCLLLYFITRKVKGSNFKIFIECMLICTVFEYLSSYLLEVIFNKTWWDYSHLMLNLNGRICLYHSFIWGALGIIFLKYIEPIILKIFKKVDFKKMTMLVVILFILFQIDGLFSCLRNIK